MKKTELIEGLKKDLSRHLSRFSELWKILSHYMDEAFGAEYVFFFVKEDLLDEVRLEYMNEAGSQIAQNQYFYQYKSFIYRSLDQEAQILERVQLELLGVDLKSTILYPIYFSEGMRGIWVLGNPQRKKKFSNRDMELLEIIFAESFSVLENLKLRSMVQVYQKEQKMITRLNKLIDANYYLAQFLKYLIELIEQTISCQIVIFLLYDEVTAQFTLEAGNAMGCEFYANQEDFFTGLAGQAQNQGTFSRTYSGKHFKGEKYGLDRLETSLVLPVKFYEKTLGVFILLNKENQANFTELDVKLMNIVIRNSKAVIFREKEKNSIVNLFKKFVSDRIVYEILENPTHGLLQEERKEISALFIDLNGFTKISEKSAPGDVIVQLNIFLTEMTELVFEYGGTLDKYIGDEIMAIFGSPVSMENHAERAVECALAMQKKMGELEKRWIKENRPPLTASVGVYTGVALVGAIGCEKYMDYTAIGDTVNVAARITEMTPPGKIWLGDTTISRMREVLDLGPETDLTLKGRDTHVEVQELNGLKSIGQLQESFESLDSQAQYRVVRCMGYFDSFQGNQIVNTSLHSPDKEIRAQAIRTMGLLNRQEDIDDLMACVEREDEQEIRELLIDVVGGISEEAVVALLKDYLGDLDGPLKSRVVQTLGYNQGEENKKLLLPLLNDSDHDVRAHVAHAIYRFGDENVIEILMRMISSHDAQMKISAIDVLGKIGTTQVVRPLMEVLYTRQPLEVHYAAARAIGRLTKPRALKFLHLLLSRREEGQDWIPLVEAIQDQDRIQKIRQSLSSMNQMVVYATLHFLETIKLYEFANDLVEIVKTGTLKLQEKGVLCLRHYPSSVVIPTFLDIMEESEIEVQEVILRELGRRKQTQLIPVINRYLDSEEAELQMAAVLALTIFERPTSIDPLIALYQNSDNANVKATVIRALGNFDSHKQIYPILVDALQSTIGRIRANAIDSLVQVGKKEEVVEMIAPLLKDENNRVRANAALALHRFDDERALKELDSMMASDDKWMRLSAIWTLAEIGTDHCQQIIVKHLNDSDYDVKLRAILSLRKLDTRLLNLLETILDSRDNGDSSVPSSS